MALPLRTSARGALALLLPLLLAAPGCADDVPTAPLLPPPLLALSLSPYIEGRVVDREPGATLRLRVRAIRDDAFVREAIVTVPPDARLYREDGSAARPDELRLGRAVIVWAAGPALDSKPPQVTVGSLFVYGRALRLGH